MILHIYHCDLADITDIRKAKGKSNRPMGIINYPDKRGKADFEFKPSTDGFQDSNLGEMLKEFQSIDILNLGDSPIEIKWEAFAKKLAMSEAELRKLMARAYEMGLLRHLTINYNFEKWLMHSNVKGCLVVMACIEKEDYEKGELVDTFCNEVIAIHNGVIGKDNVLDTIVIVPNTHLVEPARLGQDWGKNIKLLEKLRQGLVANGFKAKLASFGYTKIMHLVIHGHKLGYVYRSI